MDFKEFLFEIGTEEIPTGFLLPGLEKLKNIFNDFLKEKQIQFGQIKTFGTPRRMAILIENIALKQEDVIIEKLGPAKKSAFDTEGKPTKVAEGFAKSQGVELEDIKIVTTDKGEYISVKKEVKGEYTFDILKENLPTLIKKLIFPKNMRWGCENISFVRPIHWLLSLFDGKVVPFTYGSINSGNLSYGHRFMAPESFEVTNSESYLNLLNKKFVIPDIETRRELIVDKVSKLSQKLGGESILDQSLLETVTNLVEYPFPVEGKIEEEFLKLPEEVIITSMKVHQKYFPVYKNGKLLPNFITVSNTDAKDLSIVSKGNERVLKARLNDAKFFYNEDKKHTLDHFTERLKKVVFQRDIGTSYEKMERFRDIALYITSLLKPEIKSIVERAAYLCKGDLESSMVYEFPELQGLMGKYYAINEGERVEVAEAIYEHYKPKFAEDTIPDSDAGAFISIADRVDTITGFFAIGKIPSGTADPYALRRHAIAIIRIIIEKGYALSLKDIFNRAKLLYNSKFKVEDQVIDKIIEFISQRFENLMVEKFSHDAVLSVLSAGFDDIVDTLRKIQDVEKIKNYEEFRDIIVPFKRVANITKDWNDTFIEESLLVEEKELILYHSFTKVKVDFLKFKDSQNYFDALKSFTNLKNDINNFFDKVLVMDKDEKIKRNRLSMLKNIYNTFNSISDLTKIY